MSRRPTRYRTLNGLFKECRCERKRWSECRHPWHMGLMHGGTPYRFSLNSAGKPRGYSMSKSEADGLYELYRNAYRSATWPTATSETTRPSSTENVESLGAREAAS